MIRNVFITGRPGVGKTTAIERTLQRLDVEANGFTTREIREDGKRVGFRIENLAGESAVMAHVELEGPKVSKYGVDVDAVRRIGVSAVARAVEQGTLSIIDEVGKMELACEEFADVLLEAVEADIPVLGTVHRHDDPISRSVKRREDTRVIQITPGNREELPERLEEMIRAACEQT